MRAEIDLVIVIQSLAWTTYKYDRGILGFPWGRGPAAVRQRPVCRRLPRVATLEVQPARDEIRTLPRGEDLSL